MDPKTHRRFLSYLEAWEYFPQPGRVRLGRQQWLSLDEELRALQATAGAFSSEASARAAELRALLLRD